MCRMCEKDVRVDDESVSDTAKQEQTDISCKIKLDWQNEQQGRLRKEIRMNTK